MEVPDLLFVLVNESGRTSGTGRSLELHENVVTTRSVTKQRWLRHESRK